MDGITGFVDAIYNCYENMGAAFEDDQKLPSKDVLEDVCQTLLNISCMREEGRFPSFRVCFIRPDSELLSAYIYSHTLLFSKPIEFNTREMNKLAPALNPDMSYLVLDISERPFKAIGIIASYTTWQKIITRELTTGNRMPRIPNILVDGPGELEACFGEGSLVNYRAGHCVFYRTDTFTSTLVSQQLEKGAHVSGKERLRLLYRILWMVSDYRHGGAILIVPDEESCKEFVDIKYRLPSGYLFSDSERLEELSGNAREKEIVTYADLIAKLTSVDGSVVLTKDLHLLGFGAETLVDKMGSKHPAMQFMEFDNTENKRKQFKDNGMRHRAGYRFCSAVPDSVAFVISQDGTIEACTQHDGKVVVYDNVALPLV